jgi:hypothetical protein
MIFFLIRRLKHADWRRAPQAEPRWEEPSDPKRKLAFTAFVGQENNAGAR